MTSQQKTELSALAGTMRELRIADDPSLPQPEDLWGFIVQVEGKALRPEPYVFQPPLIIPRKKTKDVSIYRALAWLSLEDSVVDSLTATYLRECFDQDLLPCALAFRSGLPGQTPPTHHDGIRAILDFLRRNSDGELWIGEFDLRKFFDCIPHDVALAAVDRAVASAAKRGVVVDPRAIQIIKAFIKCYSFPKDVLEGALPALKRLDPDATFAWPGEDGSLDMFHPDPMRGKIGIVQGAALSSIVANLVLHHADEAVMAAMGGRTYLYQRFCDDMVLISTTKAGCQLGMDTYRQAVAELKLPIHEPIPEVPYGREFWDGKSRGPYRWTDQPGGVPWVGFCGYQLHVDQHLRIRPSSVQKQIEKMREETKLVIRRIFSAGKDGIKLSRRQILHRFEQRLICRMVGQRRPSSRPGDLSPNCVASGFKLLADHPHQRGQLRLLDRVGGECIKEVNRALRKMGAPEMARKAAPHRRKDRVRFHGNPYSLAGQYPRELSQPKP